MEASSSSPRLLTATLIVGLIAAALALLVFSWLGREIVAGVTPVVDDHFRNAIHDYASPGLTRIMIAASRYGGPAWLVPISLVLAIGFLIRGWHRGALPVSASFPSGHAFFAASIIGGLTVLVSGRVRSSALRAALWVVALGLILLIGLSRVYLGVHYPSDVFAGYAVAVVWVAGVALGDRLASHRRRRRLG
jgi:membrane-associated phospholipid phosphatase